jgi:hypothetical protein
LLTSIYDSVYAPFRTKGPLIFPHILPRCTLCDFEGLWNPFRQEKTISLVKRLNEKFTFLLEHEDATSFIQTFTVGSTHQYYRNKFKSPHLNPTYWYSDGHEFPDNKSHGLHESLKPFFKLLCVDLGGNAYQEVDTDNSEIEGKGGEDL